MANSKFSGAGFTAGQNATVGSVIAGYEDLGGGSLVNRRWTLTELATGMWATTPTLAPNLDQVLESGSLASVANSEIRIRTTAANGEAKLEATGNSGQIRLTANNTGGDISLTANDRMNFSAGQFWFGGSTTYNFQNDFNIDLYNYGGTDFRVIAIGNAGIYTGNPGSQTGGGDITLQARSGDVYLKTVSGSLGTGELKVQLAGVTPTVGQVLTAKDTAGSLEWTTPSGGGSLDFSGLNGNNARVDLTAVTSQPKYGTSEIFTALGAIEVGQVVIYDYTSGLVKATVASTLPPSNEVVGIALEDAADGDDVEVLIEGFATIKRPTVQLPSSDDYILPSLNTGSFDTRNLTNNTRFRDDGGNSNYSNNVEYGVVFDVGDSSDIPGTRYMIMNIQNFEFERQSFSFSQEDRLGIQVSNDGINYQNFDTLQDPVTGINWMQHMDNDNPPWDSDFDGGGAWYSAPALADGYVFPVSDARAADINGGNPPNSATPVSVLNKDIPITSDGTTTGTPWRYVKFIFFSNSSASFQNDGWDMTLTPSVAYSTGPANPPIGSLIYVDQNNPGQGTLNNTGSVLIGKSAASGSDNDSLFIRLLHT